MSGPLHRVGLALRHAHGRKQPEPEPAPAEPSWLERRVRELRDQPAALETFLSEELPPWQKLGARLVLMRELGIAAANRVCHRAFGVLALPDSTRRRTSGDRFRAAAHDLRGLAEIVAALPGDELERLPLDFLDGRVLGRLLQAAGSRRTLARAVSGLPPASRSVAALEPTLHFASPAPDDKLVAHELTHVVQHRLAGPGAGLSQPSDFSEREADAVADGQLAPERMAVPALSMPDAARLMVLFTTRSDDELETLGHAAATGTSCMALVTLAVEFPQLTCGAVVRLVTLPRTFAELRILAGAIISVRHMTARRLAQLAQALPACPAPSLVLLASLLDIYGDGDLQLIGEQTLQHKLPLQRLVDLAFALQPGTLDCVHLCGLMRLHALYDDGDLKLFGQACITGVDWAHLVPLALEFGDRQISVDQMCSLARLRTRHSHSQLGLLITTALADHTLQSSISLLECQRDLAVPAALALAKALLQSGCSLVLQPEPGKLCDILSLHRHCDSHELLAACGTEFPNF